jgi:peptidoglycan/xylan/chitin deacetylase (PgdA/CDA1 family)/uncharacterized caspase-like protein
MEITKRKILLIVVGLVLAAVAGMAVIFFKGKNARIESTPAARLADLIANPGARPVAEPFLSTFREVLAGYRKIIVLFTDEKTLSPVEREHVNRVGHAIYYENQAKLAQLDTALEIVASSRHDARFAVLDELLQWIESGSDLYDADRLAFRENLLTMQKAVAADQTLPAVKLHKRISEDLAALDEIEALYDKELKQIFQRFGERAIEIRRERWEDYVARLKKMFTREQILKEYGVIVPVPQVEEGASEKGEINGRGLPPKTLVLTFDDGPHGRYSEEIAAILDQYNISGVFFELGSNLGTLDANNNPKLGRLAGVSRKLSEAGHALGNHSFSHAQLSKVNDAALRSEIARTGMLLTAVSGSSPRLFRFPYGARTKRSLALLEGLGLRSVYWNIDSLDWADPVPNSIADRVLRSVDAEQRGVLLFHDINQRTVKALPTILERLTADGYRFAAWDGSGFSVGAASTVAEGHETPSTGYRESWAVVIGIDEYRKWPRLEYAARDADAVRRTLIDKLGFSASRVFMLKNQEATRSGILSLLNGKLGQGQIKRDDRIFFFFSGHGATRRLSSGRDLGYIVPVDSEPANVATDAIPMTELQNIAESLPAKHVFFVMDSCYSGLGLTRGAPPSNFLKENARRVARQMLTAGGADQAVVDGGPGGHSVFTWTLLQGLAGRGDLNGDGFITATELAAYVSPAVSSVSRQTPAFGSLPGSEGGEFVFELAADAEFLNPETKQLDTNAVALNRKISARMEGLKREASRNQSTGKAAPLQVTVQALDGGTTRLVTGNAVRLSSRKAAQRAAEQGLRLYRETRYAEAEAEFTKALKLRPDFALAANNLGFVFYKLNKYSEAARWFENAIRMDPSRAIAYYNLGDAYLKSGEKEKARKAFTTYLELAPTSGNASRAREVVRQL